MNRLKLFPVWRLSPRFEEIDVQPGVVLREVIGKHFQIYSKSLRLYDRSGRELDVHATVPGRIEDDQGEQEELSLAVSTRPVCHALGLFQTSVSRPGFVSSELGRQDVRPAQGPMQRMNDSEREVGRTVLELGLGLDLHQLDLKELADSFQKVPPGFEVSPYRIFFAAAVTVCEQCMEELDQLDEKVESFARVVADRLQILTPDALDLRLYLFVAADEAHQIQNRYSRSLSQAETFPGAIIRGWRRVFVQPYLDEEDRLLQMTHLGRALAVERFDEDARRRAQDALAQFTPLYGGGGKIYDHQRQVTVLAIEERLREQAESALLTSLQRWLSGDARESASSGIASDLARRVLEEAGLCGRLDTSESLFAETIRSLCGESLERQRALRFGAQIQQLDRRSDRKLREWIESLGNGYSDHPLAEDELERLFRTITIDASCRLRSAIEQILEKEVFPVAVPPTLALAQFFAAMEALSEEIQRFTGWDADSSVGRWLEERGSQLETRMAHARARMIREGDALFSRVGRWFGDLEPTYARLHQDLEGLELDWVELQIVRRWAKEAAKGGAEGLFGFAEQLVDRFAGLSEEILVAQQELAVEMDLRARAASLGAIKAPRESASHVTARLERMVEEMPVAEALARAVRDDGELRDLFRMSPADLLADLLDELLPSLRPALDRLVRDLDQVRLEDLLDLGLRELFVDTAVQPSGVDGVLGVLDHHTCLLAFISPPMHRQVPDMAERLEQQLRRLPGILHPPPVHLVESHVAPGLVLVRSVQALSWEEVAP